MLEVALAIWSTFCLFLSPPISITVEEEPTYPHAYAFARRYGVDLEHIDRCQVFINGDGDFDALTPNQQQAIITHEVGHCIGLQHIEGPALMERYPLMNGGIVTEADIAECRRVHSVRPMLPYRAFVSVAHD